MTALLLDTHIFVWTRVRPQRLTDGERRVLDAAPVRYVSAVVLWEIAILQGLQRIENDPKLLEVSAEFEFLSILPTHCKTLLELPRLHGDPFDRMLIAQARSEQVTLLSRDQAIESYRETATILRYPEA